MASKVNPKCRKIEIGVRTIREITIWPLSLADEITFTEKIIGIMQKYDDVAKPSLPEIPEGTLPEDIDTLFSDPENTELAIAEYIVNAIKSNLIELLSYVTDEEVTLNYLDNDQFMEICDEIYEMNFAGAVGKGLRLLTKIKNIFNQKTQSENSSSQPATDTSTSTNSATEKEE